MSKGAKRRILIEGRYGAARQERGAARQEHGAARQERGAINGVHQESNAHARYKKGKNTQGAQGNGKDEAVRNMNTADRRFETRRSHRFASRYVTLPPPLRTHCPQCVEQTQGGSRSRSQDQEEEWRSKARTMRITAGARRWSRGSKVFSESG